MSKSLSFSNFSPHASILSRSSPSFSGSFFNTFLWKLIRGLWNGVKPFKNKKKFAQKIPWVNSRCFEQFLQTPFHKAHFGVRHSFQGLLLMYGKQKVSLSASCIANGQQSLLTGISTSKSEAFWSCFIHSHVNRRGQIKNMKGLLALNSCHS